MGFDLGRDRRGELAPSPPNVEPAGASNGPDRQHAPPLPRASVHATRGPTAANASPQTAAGSATAHRATAAAGRPSAAAGRARASTHGATVAHPRVCHGRGGHHRIIHPHAIRGCRGCGPRRRRCSAPRSAETRRGRWRCHGCRHRSGHHCGCAWHQRRIGSHRCANHRTWCGSRGTVRAYRCRSRRRHHVVRRRRGARCGPTVVASTARDGMSHQRDPHAPTTHILHHRVPFPDRLEPAMSTFTLQEPFATTRRPSLEQEGVFLRILGSLMKL